jgi:hypothetical protein
VLTSRGVLPIQSPTAEASIGGHTAINTTSNLRGRPSGTSAWSCCAAHAIIRSNASWSLNRLHTEAHADVDSAVR